MSIMIAEDWNFHRSSNHIAKISFLGEESPNMAALHEMFIVNLAVDRPSEGPALKEMAKKEALKFFMAETTAKEGWL